ncbi:MAG: toll/interleukin-1 receptor domain-containing protein [Oscillospiraceae bacterium]|nr:toll/interleukin-1 receptor domain-containing protein [Oscillospiraceae bacterium]
MTRVFVSYSHESESQKVRVKKLVDFLRTQSLDVIYDGDVRLGGRLPDFMQKSVREADYVLLIFTPQYKVKADERYESNVKTTGVGFENSIINGELYHQNNEHKFIPVLFYGTWDTSVPYWAAGKMGVDLTDDDFEGTEMLKLLDALNIEQKTIYTEGNVRKGVSLDKGTKGKDKRGLFWYLATLAPFIAFFISPVLYFLSYEYQIVRVPISIVLAIACMVVVFIWGKEIASKKTRAILISLTAVISIAFIFGIIYALPSRTNSYGNNADEATSIDDGSTQIESPQTETTQILAPEDEPYQLIPFGTYDEIISILGDFIVVRNDGEYALVTNSGYEQIPFGTYEAIVSESGGVMIVYQDFQHSAITISGDEVIPFGVFHTIWAGDNDKFIVSDLEGFALIDRWLDHREVIPFGMFERIWSISGDYVMVGPANAIGLDGVADRSIIEISTLREIITSDMHEEIWGIRDGLIVVRNGGLFSVVDTNNQQVISFAENIRIISISQDLIAIESEGQYAIVDIDGNQVIPFGMFESITSIARGRAIVFRNGVPGVVQLSVLDGLFYSDSGRFSVRFVQEGDRKELAWYQGDTLFNGSFRENRDGTFGLTISNFDMLPMPIVAERDGHDLIITAGNPNRGEFFEERFVNIPTELNRGFASIMIIPGHPIYYDDGVWITDGILREELTPEIYSYFMSLRVISAITGFEWSRASGGREVLRDGVGNVVEFWLNESYARVNGEYVDIALSSGELAATKYDDHHHLFVLATFFNEPVMRPFGVGVIREEFMGAELWTTVFAR